MQQLDTPDITKAQIVAVIQPVITCAVAFGAPISEVQSAALLGLAGAISTALVIADAMIRRGRSAMMANKLTDEDLGI